MNDFCKVGIIIPAYNVEAYIHRALESCIAQTYKNIEVIVVDDGSRDNTYDVVKSYSDKDNRIKLYRQENGGVSSARNRALDMCTADYVLFLDSDDWIENNTVEKLIQNLQNDNNGYTLISSGCYYAYFDENGEIYKIIPDNETQATSISSEDALLYVGQLRYNLRSSCYKLFSMNLIKEKALRFDRDIRHGEDGLFVFEYLKNADRFIYFPDPLWDILERPGSATMVPYNSSKLSALVAVERMLEYDNDKKLNRELKKFYVQRALNVLGDALIADQIPRKDIKLLRKKLRSEFWSYIILQKNLKLKLIYMLETFGPKRLATRLLKRRNKR